MSASTNQTSLKQYAKTGNDSKASNAEERKGLTFKDWKTIKDGETKSKTVNKLKKSNNSNRTSNRGNRINNTGVCVNCLENGRFLPTKNFNGINNLGMYGNRFALIKNNFYNSLNNIDFIAIDSWQNNFVINNYQMPINLNCPHANHFTKSRNLPDSFFASDGVYRQWDLMQKPLPKPFENHTQYNEKKISNNVINKTEKVSPSVNTPHTKNAQPLGEKLKIYVPNPKASQDGKAFVPKPKLPEENLQISKEEKKQQWKEYREAMKPFKNREFYNAKRVVQRLGKKDIKELNEKELFRLTNAREIMAAHKARLSAKYSDYVKAEGKSNELGEVYILKNPILKQWEAEKSKLKNDKNYSNHRGTYRNSIMEPGRKILGGYSSFKGLVPDGMINVTTQRLRHISAF